MGLKFLDGNGEGNTADAANAIDFAVDHGARVINASWGGPAFSMALYQRSGAPTSTACSSWRPPATTASTPTPRRTTRRLRPAEHDLGRGHRPLRPAAGLLQLRREERRPRRAGRRRVLDRAARVRPERLRGFQRHVDGRARSWPAPPRCTCPSSRRRPPTRFAARFSSTVDRLPTLAGKTVTGGRLNLAKRARRRIAVDQVHSATRRRPPPSR